MARITCLLPTLLIELASGLSSFGACICSLEEVRNEH